MSELRLVVMTEENPLVTCGVNSIDTLIQGAYAKTIFKQALAYNVMIDHHIIGNCMIRFVRLHDENVDYYDQDQEFIALEITYIAIDQRVQGRSFGTKVLKMLIERAKQVATELPVRFLIIDAFKDKEDWYSNSGFKTYPKVKDLRYPGTVPMRMDLIDRKLAETYAEAHQ